MATNKLEVVLRDSPINLPSGLDSWMASIKKKVGRRILENLNINTDDLDRYIECAEIEEVPGAFVCCSFYQEDINDALTRAGLFMGAGKGMTMRTLARHDDWPLINYKKLVAGHNMPGPTLLQFFAVAEAADEPSLKTAAAELAFLQNFLHSRRIGALNERFYVIGFSIQSMKDQKSVVSHEIFHAYNFLNPDFSEAVLNFWKNTVSDEDRVSITDELGRAYNTASEDLVIDEFQAYLLQDKADLDYMKAFVPKYRASLLEELKENQINLIKF